MSTSDRTPAPGQRPPRRIVVRQAPAAPPPTLPEQPTTVLVQPPAPRFHVSCWAVGCLILAVGCLIVVAIPVVLGVDVVNKIQDGISYMVEGLRNGFEAQPVAQVTSRPSVIESIQPLGQLVSVEMQLAKADLRVDIRQGVLNACSFSANYVAVGVITAGIDLTQVSDTDIRYNSFTDTYTLTLPPPHLTFCDVRDVNQYGESLTLCNVDWDSARQLAEFVALRAFVEDAQNAGILDRAQQQTSLVLGSFVQSLTGSHVNIEYREGIVANDPACEPEPPGVWTYDSTQNAWIAP
jgi:hypothetical protein